MDTQKIVEYFKGIKSEWGKITWPDRKQVVAQTIIVLVIVVLFTIYIYGLDLLLQGIIKALKLSA